MVWGNQKSFTDDGKKCFNVIDYSVDGQPVLKKYKTLLELKEVITKEKP